MTAPTSAIVASYVEVQARIRQGMQFPLIVIPFGAENDDQIPCQCFKSRGAITREAIEELLEYALPLATVPRLHLISGSGNLMWEGWAEGVFHLRTE